MPIITIKNIEENRYIHAFIESIIYDLNEEFNEIYSIAESSKSNSGWFLKFLYNFVAYISKFIEKLQEITDIFRSRLSKVMRDDKYIMSSKDYIDRYNQDTNAVIADRFIYTHIFDNEIPIPKTATNKSDYFITLAKFSYMNRFYDPLKKGKIEELKELNKKFIDENEEFLNQFRSAIFNDNGYVPESVFSGYCSRMFRNNHSNYELSGVVTYNEMKDTFYRFSNMYGECSKIIKELADNLRSEYNEIIDLFRKKSTEVKYFKDEGVYQNDLENEMRIYYTNKANRIQSMSNIHMTAFSAKIYAIERSYVQDKTILLRCIDNVMKHKKDK